MGAIAAIIGPLLTLILTLVTEIFKQRQAHKDEKNAFANKLSDAVASNDIARINDVVQQLRS